MSINFGDYFCFSDCEKKYVPGVMDYDESKRPNNAKIKLQNFEKVQNN